MSILQLYTKKSLFNLKKKYRRFSTIFTFRLRSSSLSQQWVEISSRFPVPAHTSHRPGVGRGVGEKKNKFLIFFSVLQLGATRNFHPLQLGGWVSSLEDYTNTPPAWRLCFQLGRLKIPLQPGAELTVCNCLIFTPPAWSLSVGILHYFQKSRGWIF